MLIRLTVLELAWTELPAASRPSSGMQVWVVMGFLFLYLQLSYSSASLWYSEESESEESEEEVGNRRVLAWFFSQFFVLASLIVALQGLCPLVPFRTDPIIDFWISGIASSLSFSVHILRYV